MKHLEVTLRIRQENIDEPKKKEGANPIFFIRETSSVQ